MQYFGGKFRISKDLSNYFNTQVLKPNQTFVDLFCGSCNIISKIDNNRMLIANDKHYYLIEMFKALQNGWIPPEFISEDQYKNIKLNSDLYPDYLVGFVGFGCSFAGKWWRGYCRSNVKRNYCLSAKKSLIYKMQTNLNYIEFKNLDYKDIKIPTNSIVYCDIPYNNSTSYCLKEVGKFNHLDFYTWVLDNKNNFTCYISEYKENILDKLSQFQKVWEKDSSKSVRNKSNKLDITTEVLITPYL